MLKTIAFDADDTLWVNQPYFDEAEKKVTQLLSPYLAGHSLEQELFKTEINNLPLYGYGVKGYVLSMIEAALKVSNQTISTESIEKIIQYGKDLLEKPVELLDGVEETLKALKGKYKLVVATKGDLLDQQRKLHKSGLGHYFHHIEVMSDKQEVDYQKLINRLEIPPTAFLMIGNSLKSDILPVLAIGGQAFHIPYHSTWEHEKVDFKVEHQNMKSLEKISDILQFL
jgi:putative hydrolase of the HAD superfamily